MPDNDLELNNHNSISQPKDTKGIEAIKDTKITDQRPNPNSSPKWINNRGEEVKQVFGFNENAELVNARVAMIGFLMLILTELAFAGEPATQAIFGIN
tara:strand:- start:321 stop:614 length:294 start_codon:yes stop_codon:yes gene_type:complete